MVGVASFSPSTMGNDIVEWQIDCQLANSQTSGMCQHAGWPSNHKNLEHSLTQRGIFSIEKGSWLVQVLASSAGPMTLTALAAAAGLSASVAHRYLVSLIRANLVEQLPDGTYDLGTLALTAGLAKLARLDSYRIAQTSIEALGRSSGETALMAMWNGRSAVAIRWIESPRPVTVFVRPGSLLPVLNSATGRVFAAFLPEAAVKETIEQELLLGVRPTSGGSALDQTEFSRLLEDVRKRGLARVSGDLTFGIDALAAPVLNHHGQIAFAFALVGPSGAFRTEWDSPVAKLLVAAAADCTTALGGLWRWPVP